MNDFVQSEESKERIRKLVAQRKIMLGHTQPYIAPTIAIPNPIPPQSDKVIEIIYNGQYINGNALKVFTTFTDRNQYLIKSSTGAGGTTAMLNQTETNVIIITPNRSQVIDKEAGKHNYLCHKAFFIYGDNPNSEKDTWKQVQIAMQNRSRGIVVMTTLDSFMHLITNNNELFEYFRNHHLLIDEYHVVIKDAYRKLMGELYIQVQSWKATIKFSTATPHPRFLDLPPNMNIEIIKLTSDKKRNQRVFYSTKRNDAKKFITDQLTYGHRVILFSNDIKYYNSYHKSFGDERVQFGTGHGLRLSTNRFIYANQRKKVTKSDVEMLRNAIADPQKRLFILSTAFFAGFDFTEPCSIVILSDQLYKNYTFDWLDKIQSLGRARKDLINVLIIDAPPSKNGKQRVGEDWIEYTPAITEQSLEEKLSYIPKDNDIKNVRRRLFVTNEFFTFNETARQSIFADYGYYLEPYVNDRKIPSFDKYKFSEQILRLMSMGEDELYRILMIEGTHEIRNQIREDDVKVDIGCIHPELILRYYIAYILVKYNPIDLITELHEDVNRSIKLKDFALEVREFLLPFFDTQYHNIPFEIEAYEENLNESQPTEFIVYRYLLLYAGCGFEEDTEFKNVPFMNEGEIHYNYDTTRQLKLSIIMHDRLLLTDLVDGSKGTIPNKTKRVIMAFSRLMTRIKNAGLSLSNEEKEYVRTNIRRNFEYLDDWHNENIANEIKWKQSNPKVPFIRKEPHNINTKKSLLKKIRRACIYFFTMGKGSYEPKMIDGREYSPLTNLPKNLRIALPIKFISFDIKSANPSIICSLLNADNNVPFYTNLERKFSLGKGEGKVKFNSTINTHSMPKDVAIDIYVKAGLDPDKAIVLANMTAGVEKGSMFRTMIAEEYEYIVDFIDDATDKYKDILSRDMFYRLHDAVIIPKYALKDCVLNLKFNKISFEKQDFNGSFEWGF